MKKTLFVLVFACVCVLSAHSQLRFGIRGGLNVTEVSGDWDEFIDKDVTGFHIGPTIEWLIGGTFGIEGSVLYSEKGIKIRNRKKDTFGYIDVPVSLKYRFQISNIINPFIDAGPYVSFRVSGEDSFNESWETIGDQWKAKTFGAGLNFGAGIELLRHLQIKGNYGLSLTDNYKLSDGNYSWKEKTWSVTASVYF